MTLGNFIVLSKTRSKKSLQNLVLTAMKKIQICTEKRMIPILLMTGEESYNGLDDHSISEEGGASVCSSLD